MASGPVEEIVFGAVRVTVWRNSVSDGTGTDRSFLSATASRRYRDASGEWRDAHSFTLAQLPVVRRALEIAESLMIDQEAYASASGEEAQ